MTEAEWLDCNGPQAMLAFLRGKASDRKLRLFACASCRRIWGQVTDERCRQVVEIVEAMADGEGAEDELDRARNGIRDICSRSPANQAVWLLAWGNAEEAARVAAEVERHEIIEATLQRYAREGDPRDLYDQLDEASPHAEALAQGCQANLLRDLVGNPFHPLPAVASAWPAWGDGAAAKIARAIYEERRFGDLPILADALGDAGCTDIDVLAHCRQPGEHVRGCWVIDWLLGKS